MTQKQRKYFFVFFVAFRYLFSQKKQNVINVISYISMCGVAVGSLALVCVLSVFNGFDQLVKDNFSTFDPDLKIVPKEGKFFSTNDSIFQEIKTMKEVAFFSEVLEENALLTYKDYQLPISIKGIDSNARNVSNLDESIIEGENLIHNRAFQFGIVGIGVANQIPVSINFSESVQIYAPKINSKINLARPETSFSQQNVLISGVFTSKQEQYDNKYLFIDIQNARTLFERKPTEVSAIELKINKDFSIEKVKKKIGKLLGKDFSVLNRYEQQADLYRIVKIEKWVTYLILFLIMIVATFNIIGSLSMLIIEKKEDIQTLQNLGTDEKTLRQIFLCEGWLISIVGAVVGITIGLLICLSQQYFGWLKMGTGYIVDTYPVLIHFSDLLLTFFTVVFLGFITAYYPSKYIKNSK